MPAAIIELNQISLELINIMKENFITEKHKEHKTTVTLVFSVLGCLDSHTTCLSATEQDWSYNAQCPSLEKHCHRKGHSAISILLDELHFGFYEYYHIYRRLKTF